MEKDLAENHFQVSFSSNCVQPGERIIQMTQRIELTKLELKHYKI